MIKTKNRSAAKKTAGSAKTIRTKRKPVKLNAEQQARLDAVRLMVAQWQREWDKLSPKEQQEEYDGWKRAMNNMNEDRRRSGQRLLFLEPIE